MHPNISQRYEVCTEFRALCKTHFPEQALRCVEAVVGKFLEDNPDDRKAGYRARKTLKHLRNVLRHHDSHPDATVRRAARKLVKIAGHPVAFGELERRARQFNGLLQEVGHNRKERVLLENAERRRVAGDGLLEEVVSRARLQSIGKQLALCVGRTRMAGIYFNDVEEGETELWAYYRSDALQALIELRASDRTIAECQAHGNATPKFKLRQATAILAALNANGDDNKAFAGAGAYSVFRRGFAAESQDDHFGQGAGAWALGVPLRNHCEGPQGRTEALALVPFPLQGWLLAGRQEQQSQTGRTVRTGPHPTGRS